MKIVNTNQLEEIEWTSPRGKYSGFGKQVSIALGRERESTDHFVRHPFDVEILRVPPRATPYVYHAHNAQWEFYHVIAGTGTLRHEGGIERIGVGDAFVCKPFEAHQLANDSDEDLVVYVVADNPLVDTCYYPDSDKWEVGDRTRTSFVGGSPPLDYFEGEE